MSNIDIMSVTSRLTMEVGNPPRTIEATLTLSFSKGLTLDETQECIDSLIINQIKSDEEIQETSSPGIDEESVMVYWDKTAIQIKTASYLCKKCSKPMVSQYGIGKNGKPYLLIKCPGGTCPSSFFLSWVNFVTNVKDLLQSRPEWTPKNYSKQEA